MPYFGCIKTSIYFFIVFLFSATPFSLTAFDSSISLAKPTTQKKEKDTQDENTVQERSFEKTAPLETAQIDKPITADKGDPCARFARHLTELRKAHGADDSLSCKSDADCTWTPDDIRCTPQHCNDASDCPIIMNATAAEAFKRMLGSAEYMTLRRDVFAATSICPVAISDRVCSRRRLVCKKQVCKPN